jgi:ribose transport system ATP-binding protein
MGMLSEDRAGEGLAVGLSIADSLTGSRLDGLGPGFMVLPSRQVIAARELRDRLTWTRAPDGEPIDPLLCRSVSRRWPS